MYERRKLERERPKGNVINVIIVFIYYYYYYYYYYYFYYYYYQNSFLDNVFSEGEGKEAIPPLF